MSEMVERLCRAAFAENRGETQDPADFNELPEGSKSVFRRMMWAALSELREPTGDMLLALMRKREQHDLVCGVRWETATILDLWQAAIDEALK